MIQPTTISMLLNMRVDEWTWYIARINRKIKLYIGSINMKTWMFERLVSAVVPFYSNEFMTAYSPARGYYVLAWPEPDYDPYIRLQHEWSIANS